MAAARHSVAEVFQRHWPDYNRTYAVPPQAAEAARHIMLCRTAKLGGHLYECDQCSSQVPVYNSCMDRHCPTCQTVRKQDWLEARRVELLPVAYFHTVFTLPHSLNPLVDANRRVLLNEFFHTVHWVLQHFADDPQWRLKGLLGYIAVLHTWNQRLLGHFHIHCIVPGGVWQRQTGRWVSSRERYLFGKGPLAAAFRNRFCVRLEALRRQGKLAFGGRAEALADPIVWAELLAELKKIRWAVWPKRTAAGPAQALDYLGRYTHRVAISNHRILKLHADSVTFSWRDRADGNTLKPLTLPAHEFIRRFIYHVLPKGFQKIRYYGWLSPARKKTCLPAIRQALHAPEPAPPIEETSAERIRRLTGVDVRRCPHCGKSALSYLGKLPRYCGRGPPCS